MKATVVGISLVLLFSFASACDYAVEKWCSTPQIAEECDAREFCEKFIWENKMAAAAPVNIELYFESLCPYCRQFIGEQLYQTYIILSPIMNLTLIPYGNAQEKLVNGKWVFTCQHGPGECRGNIIETCAIHVMQNITNYLPFIYCFEAVVTENNIESVAQQCATSLGFNYNSIDACTKSDLGNQLQHAYALKTQAQKQKYVPWIVVNGVHNEDQQGKAQENLLQFVCDTYQGPKPPACNHKLGRSYA